MTAANPDGRLAALAELVDRSHRIPPALYPGLVREAARGLGAVDADILLQDYDQLTLRHWTGGAAESAVDIDGTDAGRSFRTLTNVQAIDGDRYRLWVPLLDGTDRVGVLQLAFDAEPDDDLVRACETFAGVVADHIVTKGLSTDLVFLARRSRPMNLAAEMQWHLLPPLTVATPEVAIAGALEPAYEVGGDAFDYAVNDDTVHLVLIDAMGHGLDASLLATVAIGAFRHGRRRVETLQELYAAMDEALASEFEVGKFVTAFIAVLDLGSGRLRWVNAGHPAPLRLRAGGGIDIVETLPSLPIGLGGDTPQVHELLLERGDQIFLFTDGIVENEREDGEPFGLPRLVDAVRSQRTEGNNLAEAVRQISLRAREFHRSVGRDDSTVVLLEWRGPHTDAEARRESDEPRL